MKVVNTLTFRNRHTKHVFCILYFYEDGTEEYIYY